MSVFLNSRTSRSLCLLVTFLFLWLLDLSNQTVIGKGEVIDLDRLVLPPVESLDCIHFQSEEGVLTAGIKGTSDTTCGLYLIGELDTRITVEFVQFEAHCDKGSLVAVLDGWEQAGSTFPAASDLSAEDAKNQYNTYCGESHPLLSFVSSGNFALIQYKLAPGDRFTVRVTFQRNPRPCNQVAQGDEGFFVMRNFRQRLNCSVMIIHPQNIFLPYMSVGNSRRMNRRRALQSRLPRPKKLSLLQKLLQVTISAVHITRSTTLN
ncbi:hypothetical protein RvY_01196 [Ramazzottius varieornatus]|uniref:Corticotropin-releasing factor-binding protein n=1 Tax=Ramazzottius varieornatus TaxID=947166 RepID=A0A1D1UFG1_RAMVA|nr:hypothetical protein RvY_01196 [Ramazzottius varieornatus]